MAIRGGLWVGALGLAACAARVTAQQQQTFNITDLPYTWQDGQTGNNQCAGGDSQTSECQTIHINSLDDFCLWAPPEANSAVATTEEIEVAWCTKAGHGARIIPEGTITGAHFVVTADFVQVTGVGQLTSLNIAAGDEGGELDPHGATGLGNPRGGLVFSNAFSGGEEIQLLEWTNFMSADQFCIRACRPGPNAWLWCNHIYDTMGCDWNMPANYADDSFDTCLADPGTPMGIYSTPGNGWGSTFHQGDPATPAAHPIPASSSCTPVDRLARATQMSPPYPSSSASQSRNVTSSTVSSNSTSSTSSSSSSSSSSTSSSSVVLTTSTTPTFVAPALTVTAPTSTRTVVAEPASTSSTVEHSGASRLGGRASLILVAASLVACLL